MSWRVLHVLDHSWPVLDGYAQRRRSIVGAQSLLGMQPAVLTGPLHERDDPSAQETNFEGVRYFRTSDRTGFAGRALRAEWPVFRELAVVRLLQERIKALLRSESFDVVHAHSPALCGLAAAHAARSCRVPCVYEIRAFWEDGAVFQSNASPSSPRYRLTRMLETHVVHRANAVVGIALPLLQDIEDRGISRDKLFHVPNGVDVSRFSPRVRDATLASELGVDNVPVLGFLGTLFPWEGVSWLVSAAAELHKRGIDFRLLIIGDGADSAAVTKAIQNANAGGYVSYLGRVPNDRVEQYYSLMDVLVYPRSKVRLTELVTPLKPLEAMALGKAILGSNVGGIRELIDEDSIGVLFEAENVDDFCRQASRLLLDKHLRDQLGQCARRKIVEKKDWKTIVQRYDKIYAYARESFSARA